METKDFIEACRYIGRSLGQPDEKELLMQCVSGRFDHDQEALFYKAETMLIGVAIDDLSLVVERLENKNPVVVIRGNGEQVRWHTEACYLYSEVVNIICRIGRGLLFVKEKKNDDFQDLYNARLKARFNE